METALFFHYADRFCVFYQVLMYISDLKNHQSQNLLRTNSHVTVTVDRWERVLVHVDAEAAGGLCLFVFVTFLQTGLGY